MLVKGNTEINSNFKWFFNLKYESIKNKTNVLVYDRLEIFSS